MWPFKKKIPYKQMYLAELEKEIAGYLSKLRDGDKLTPFEKTRFHSIVEELQSLLPGNIHLWPLQMIDTLMALRPKDDKEILNYICRFCGAITEGAGVNLLPQGWKELEFKEGTLYACPDCVDQPFCRVCGCTHGTPCEEGCWWIEEDLCSACGGK